MKREIFMTGILMNAKGMVKNVKNIKGSNRKEEAAKNFPGNPTENLQ